MVTVRSSGAQEAPVQVRQWSDGHSKSVRAAFQRGLQRTKFSGAASHIAFKLRL